MHTSEDERRKTAGGLIYEAKLGLEATMYACLMLLDG